MSIVLASGSVMFLAVAIHLSMALLGALLVGAGAGMAFLAGTTLLGGEVGDEVRGRVFAVVQIGTRLVLLLAISLSGVLVGLGSSRRVAVGDLFVDVSSTRAAAAGRRRGRGLDRDQRVPADGRQARRTGARRPVGLDPRPPAVAGRAVPAARHLRGLRGRRGRRQVAPRSPAWPTALRAQGRDVVVTREPGATDVGARIRGLVLDETEAPSPRAEALLYAADRAHHVATVVRPALARGAVVISDRYVDSSLAYQGAGRTLPVQEISWLSSWATGGLKPDLVVLLDVDPSVGLARVDSRGLGTDRLESESRAFHDRVRYAFLDLAAADPKRYLVLDAARPADEIGDAVTTRLKGLLAAGDEAHPADASTAVPPGLGPGGSRPGGRPPTAEPALGRRARGARTGSPPTSGSTHCRPVRT